LASTAAQNTLAQVTDGSHQYLVDRAQATINDAKVIAKSQRDQMTTPSFQTNADTLILNARPNAQDIVDAQQIVNVANTNSSDEDLMETARKILLAVNSDVQATLDQGKSEDRESLESLQMLLMEAMNNASSLLTRVTDFSDEEKEERLREVNAKRQELSDEIQARLDGIAQPTWLKKNLVWVIVGSVVIALFLLYAFFKYIGRRN
jgi:hypothetical protein